MIKANSNLEVQGQYFQDKFIGQRAFKVNTTGGMIFMNFFKEKMQ